MTKRTLRRLAPLLLLSASAWAVAAAPAHAQNDWWRRQQQQEQQRRQQQQQQQQDLDRQRRYDQQQQQRRQQQLQEQQRIRQQMQEQIQRDLRARAQREQQQRQQAQRQQTQQRQQQQQRNRATATGAQRLGGQAGVSRAAAGRGPSASSVARLNRPLTAAELRRGFTGKITLDGRALVRVGNRVLAVPASRVGVKVNRVQSPSVASRWNASKRAAVSDTVRKLAATSPKNSAGAAGGGGRRRPPGGGGGSDGEPPRWNRTNVQFGHDANSVAHAFRHTDKAGLDRDAVQEAVLVDLEKIGHYIAPEGHHNGFVFIDGSAWQYRAFKLPNGRINVGSISPPSTRR